MIFANSLQYIKILPSIDLWAGAVTEGLVHELPSADAFQQPPATEETTTAAADDLEELRKQLEALNAD